MRIVRQIPDRIVVVALPACRDHYPRSQEQAMSVPDRATFENAYSGEAPWDVGRPQKVFIDAAERITGSILAVGCGTGENALFFAARGHKVAGIDFLAEPIERAKRKAEER